MQPIGNALRKSGLLNVRRLPADIVTQPSKATPLGSDGLPVDRTVCPACRNGKYRDPEAAGDPHDDRDDKNMLYMRDTCPVCDYSGTVCPTCRGAHWLTLRRPNYGAAMHGVCPDCMTPTLDESGKHVFDATLNRHRYHRHEQHELDAIRRYRDKLAREAA